MLGVMETQRVCLWWVVRLVQCLGPEIVSGTVFLRQETSTNSNPRPKQGNERNALWCKKFCEKGKHVRAGFIVNLAHAFDQPSLVHCSNLVQHDLAILPLETKRNPRWIGSPLRRHGSYDHRIDMTIHFIGRDDKARTGFADFSAFGGI